MDIFGFLRNLRFSVLQLREVVKSLKSGFGAGKQDQELSENGVIHIRPTNIDSENRLKFDRNIYLPVESLTLNTDYILTENDVLFNNTNSQELVGKTSIFKGIKDNCLYSNHITRIKADESKIYAYFLSILLNLYHQRKIFYNICTNWNNQSGVGLELLKSLKIPVPPLPVQEEIVSIMEEAYAVKRTQEAEAAALLGSIEGYLTEMLGISIPATNDAPTKYFLTPRTQIAGGRLDPKRYVPENQTLLNCLSDTKYHIERLNELVIHSISGDWGNEEDTLETVRCLVIRSTEFDNRYNLTFNNERTKYRYIKVDKFKKMDIQALDLLIEKSGGSEGQPVGRVALITKNLLENDTLAFSNFICKIRVDSVKANPEYVFNYLKFLHTIKITDLMQSQTNGIRNLIMREFLTIPIPLPPLSIQEEIADHVRSLREQARTLEAEAVRVVAEAKAQVEAMILGN